MKSAPTLFTIRITEAEDYWNNNKYALLIIYCDIYITNNSLLIFITKKNKIKTAPSLFTITETENYWNNNKCIIYCDITDFYRTENMQYLLSVN